MNATTIWAPHPQLPAGPYLRTVIINGQLPIIDQDILIPHPTPTMHSTTSVGFKCLTYKGNTFLVVYNRTAGGREPAVGHSRKLFATSMTVWINGRRAGRFGDPLGDQTPAFPCTSVVTGCSPNVFVGV